MLTVVAVVWSLRPSSRLVEVEESVPLGSRSDERTPMSGAEMLPGLMPGVLSTMAAIMMGLDAF